MATPTLLLCLDQRFIRKLTLASLLLLSACVPPDSRYQSYGSLDECVYDDDCVETAYCYSDPADPYAPNVCMPVCIDDFDCGEGLHCDQNFGECIPGCNEVYDCELGSYCDPESQQDVRCLPGCLSDLNCGASGEPEELPELVCISASRREVGACTLTCVSDRECEEGEVCVLDPAFDDDLSFGVCLPGCESDRSCTEGMVCDLEAQSCVEGCRSDRDCPAGPGRESPLELCVVPEGETLGRCETACES
ncbi:MAG: hypothetical protein VYD19_02405, partial [Myxococcota bacterium]|nr:hypothetical protein [Myxococcota bacterium]